MHWLASNSWRCYFRVLTLKLSLAPLHWSQSTLNVVYRVLSDQQPSRPPPGWWWRTVHVLRSRRCLIITAHLLIRATEPGVFDKCFSPSQSVQKRRRRKIRPNLISYYHNCTIITVRPHNIYINAHFTSDRTTACVSPAKEGAAVGGFTLANPIQLIIFNIVLLYWFLHF